MRATRSLEIGTGLFVILGFAALFFLTTQLPSSGLKLSFVKSCRLRRDRGIRQHRGPQGRLARYDGRSEDRRCDRDRPRHQRLPGGRSPAHLPAVQPDPGRQLRQYPDRRACSAASTSASARAAQTYLKNGSHIEQTQSAIVLENLINKFFANFASGSSSSSGDRRQRQ